MHLQVVYLQSAAEGAGNTTRPLTHSSDLSREGLAVNATRCGLDDCDNYHHAKGYCAKHAARLARTGDPRGIRRTTTLDSFWKRVDKSGDCWMWTGYVLSNGYGQIATRKQPTASGTRLAHRVAYELVRGPIPDGLVLDHLCRTRLCVNPDHLEPVTEAENVRRGLHGVLRTHCQYGHELTIENTLYDERTNCRRCKRCSQASSRATSLRNRIGNETYKASRRKPCQRCGGRKGPGPRRKLCDACMGASIRSQYAVAGRGEGA